MTTSVERSQRSDWHSLPVEQTLKQLDSTRQGLSEREAERRLQYYGLNRLPVAAKNTAVTRFLLQFHNILIYVLIASAIITAFLDHWIDTGVILAVVVANAIIGFLQEGKAEKAMDAIRHMLAPSATAIREGERKSLAGESLVPGDIVVLEAGDKVPADVRLLTAHGLAIQEAILTGESVPVEKHSAVVDVTASLGDRSGMAFSGTLVSTGQGRGVVVATGAHTEIGRISGLLSNVEVLTTPLVAQMGVFAKWLTIMILLLASLLLVYGIFILHYPFTDLFIAVVGLSVAAIPEGLPAVLTITLAIGVQAMAKRNAIVRRLPAIETLGSVSVICSDKTGTLTRNEMMVASAIDGQKAFTLEGSGYTPEGAIKLEDITVAPKDHVVLDALARAAVLCNDAALREHKGVWGVEGDPMEGALLAFAQKADLDIHQERSTWTRTDAIPFDAKHRFMATLNHNHEGLAAIFIKGAPETILNMCHLQLSASGDHEPLKTNYWMQHAENIAASGQRLLAFAMQDVSPTQSVLQISDIGNSLTFLGMLGMMDPPRLESISAIEKCHAAGIQVKMITGDHAITARAIADQIGLKNTEKVLRGVDLDELSDAELKEAVVNCNVYARTSPQHKLRLVMALQSQGMTVAMTGDGVNDAPALKRADAGIAMGKKGSEAAKEASELVLADDNFASIVAAVLEGRTVYDNIKKVISWTLPTNGGEAMTVILALLMGTTLPVTSVQILWVNMITAVTLGIALAFEPTEDNTMQRPPRPRGEPLLTLTLVWYIVLVSFLFLCGVYGIFTYAIDRGDSVEQARTLALNTLVVMEIFQLFFIRNIYGTSLTWKAVRGTRIVWLVVVIVTLAQLCVTYLPPLQVVFGTRAVSFLDGVLVFAIGIALFAIIETEKQIRLRVVAMRS